MDATRPKSKHNKLVRLRGCDADRIDVATLIAWSRDDDAEVRDWATFTLGVGRNADSEEIRNALRARLDDPDFDTRCEAFVGLARRGDEGAIPALLRAFEGESVGTLMVEALAYYGRPEFVPLLQELKDWWDVDDELLERAISHCSGARRDEFWETDG